MTIRYGELQDGSVVCASISLLLSHKMLTKTVIPWTFLNRLDASMPVCFFSLWFFPNTFRMAVNGIFLGQIFIVVEHFLCTCTIHFFMDANDWKMQKRAEIQWKTENLLQLFAKLIFIILVISSKITNRANAFCSKILIFLWISLTFLWISRKCSGFFRHKKKRKKGRHTHVFWKCLSFQLKVCTISLYYFQRKIVKKSELKEEKAELHWAYCSILSIQSVMNGFQCILIDIIAFQR